MGSEQNISYGLGEVKQGEHLIQSVNIYIYLVCIILYVRKYLNLPNAPILN